MTRVLLIVAAIVAALFLLGPLVGLLFTLLKWALIIGLVAAGVMFVSKWANSKSAPRS
ncbi:hypothetical protein HII36_13625 [Nonomuraea sp. NN258]|uniref:hypothetical protein n=1 Tax=Nonomuraea antri TaxID=2730852 RepID=UPI001569DACE|nr:hypothetical protein [Nonomuraea antri]NRQ32872.1 hypothetical protein [Nonomuraea antri]